MSLTIVLEGVDGIVMAADSRVTEGYSLSGPKTSDTSIKFVKINKDWGAMTYGLSEIGFAGINALKNETQSGDSFNNLLGRAEEIFVRERKNWDRKNPEIGSLEKNVGFILGGYDNDTCSCRIVNFKSSDFTPQIISNDCLIAGQWQIAKYIVTKLYRKDFSMGWLKVLAVFMLDSTMKVEKTVGGAINLATITPSNGFKWVEDVEQKVINEKVRQLGTHFHQEYSSALSSIY